MAFVFGKISKKNLVGLHPDLISVAFRALEISPVDFRITEGLRTPERQRYLVADGKSKTLKSRHLTGHALDVAAIVAGKISWNWEYYEDIAKAFKQAAKELGVSLEWGGDWKSFRDGPHFQLAHKEYPAL